MLYQDAERQIERLKIRVSRMKKGKSMLPESRFPVEIFIEYLTD
jgi:hypothetical protein